MLKDLKSEIDEIIDIEYIQNIKMMMLLKINEENGKFYINSG